MKKSAIYLRCSTDMQEQSIPDQRKAIHEYAKANGYEIVKEYINEGISGTETEKRIAFKRMCNDVILLDSAMKKIRDFEISCGILTESLVHPCCTWVINRMNMN